MTPTPEEVAYERGVRVGQNDTRLGTLEVNSKEQTHALSEISKLVTSLTTTVQLLDKDIKTRAENDRRNEEQRDQNTKDIAKAVKDVVDQTALTATKAREDLAQSLLDKTNLATIETSKANTKFIPKMFWIAVVGVIATLLSSGVTVIIMRLTGH